MIKSHQNLINQTALAIQKSRKLEDLLNTVVTEIRNILDCDRVIIYQLYQPDWNGVVVTESVVETTFSLQGFDLEDHCFKTKYVEPYQRGKISRIENIYTEPNLTECYQKFLAKFQVYANLVVPIICQENLWGLLIAHDCTRPRSWEDDDLDVMCQIATLTGISIQQMILIEELQARVKTLEKNEISLKKINKNLEKQVKEKTEELTQVKQILQQEITTRKPQEKFLDSFLNALSNVQIGGAIFNLDLQFLKVNQYLADLNGHPISNYLNSQVTPLINDEIAPTLLSLLKQVINTQKAIYNVEFSYKISPNSSQLCWGLMSAFPILDQDHQFTAIGTFFQEMTEQKITKETLRESQRLFQHYQNLLLEAQAVAQIGNWEHDLPSQKVIWTEELFHIFDREKTQEILSYPEILELFHPEDREKLRLAVEQIITNHKPYKLLLKRRIPKPDGSIGYIEAIGKVELNDQGQITRLYGTAQDVSERVYSEQAIRESELRFRGIFEQMFLFIGLISPEGMIWELNPSALQFIGYERSQVIGQFFWELNCWMTPETVERLKQAFHQVLQGEVVHDEIVAKNVHHQVLITDFSLRPILDDQGKLVYLIAEGRDITEHKQIEANLQESHRRLQSLLDHIQLIVIQLNYEGIVEYINPFFFNLTRYSKTEVLGKPWYEVFIPPYLRSNMKLALSELLEQGMNTYYQNPIITQSGEERMIAWNNTVLRDLQGRAIGCISIGEDITERYKLEQMKAEFVSTVSHELRTPLTSMQTALSLLHEKLIDPTSPQGERIIEVASQSIDRLVRLVNDILDLERLESGKIKLNKNLCYTDDLIKMAVNQMQEMANQGNIRLEVIPISFPIIVDGDRLLQVLVNLLSNAIKFSPNHSTIRVLVERLVEYHGPYLLFTIEDCGRGIPPHKLESIFERFQQIDSSDSREKGGTGLGLTICRNIIEQHGGKIWVESVLGRGSKFRFTLPI